MEVHKYMKSNMWQMPNKGTIHLTQMRYHSSWDWLMPVVKKINKTWETSGMDGDQFLPGEQIIQVIRLTLGQVDIETAHEQVVKFITWLNSEQSAQVSDTTGDAILTNAGNQ